MVRGGRCLTVSPPQSRDAGPSLGCGSSSVRWKGHCHPAQPTAALHARDAERRQAKGPASAARPVVAVAVRPSFPGAQTEPRATKNLPGSRSEWRCVYAASCRTFPRLGQACPPKGRPGDGTWGGTVCQRVRRRLWKPQLLAARASCAGRSSAEPPGPCEGAGGPEPPPTGSSAPRSRAEWGGHAEGGRTQKMCEGLVSARTPSRQERQGSQQAGDGHRCWPAGLRFLSWEAPELQALGVTFRFGDIAEQKRRPRGLSFPCRCPGDAP